MSINRMDVIIPRPRTFIKMVEEYKMDPCGKLLVRMEDGMYDLKEKL